MKRIVKFFIPLIILGAIGFYFRDTLSGQFLPAWNVIRSQIFKKAPCAEPIPYTLGTFDTQFNISKSYFLSALTDAEAIWEKPQGDSLRKELFTYTLEDKSFNVLKVNLIYDYRQQATSKLESLGITVKDNRASYDMLKAKFTSLKAEYEKEKSDYESTVKAFNGGDRTNEAEFKNLERERQNLNNKVDEINALVVVLNRLVATLNLSVDKYNTTNVARGESFEEGVYSTDGANREIDIYEFSSREKLVRVLAHELGHALDLDHVEDPKAIMYKLNQGSNITLTKADLAALKTKCAEE